MTTYEATIVDEDGALPTLGDDLRIIRTVTGLLSGQIIEKAWLTIKNRFTDLDADALLQLEITAVDSAAGQITEDGTGDVVGELLFRLAGVTDYANLLALKNYPYDIQVLLDDGVINTLEVGRIRWERQVTLSRS